MLSFRNLVKTVNEIRFCLKHVWSVSQLPLFQVSGKILELARKQRMNTDVRRNIFCTIMTSEDFLDAFEKLLK